MQSIKIRWIELSVTYSIDESLNDIHDVSDSKWMLSGTTSHSEAFVSNGINAYRQPDVCMNKVWAKGIRTNLMRNRNSFRNENHNKKNNRITIFDIAHVIFWLLEKEYIFGNCFSPKLTTKCDFIRLGWGREGWIDGGRGESPFRIILQYKTNKKP